MRISHYSFGEMTVDGTTYTSDLLLFPDRVEADWWRREGHRLCMEDLSELLAGKPEVLVIGCGASGVLKVPESVKNEVEAKGIRLIADPTPAAVERFNDLSEKQMVAGGFHLTC